MPEVGRVDEGPCVHAGTPSRVPACSTSSRRVPRLGARGGRAEQAVGHSRRRRVGGRSGPRGAPARGADAPAESRGFVVFGQHVVTRSWSPEPSSLCRRSAGSMRARACTQVPLRGFLTAARALAESRGSVRVVFGPPRLIARGRRRRVGGRRGRRGAPARGAAINPIF